MKILHANAIGLLRHSIDRYERETDWRKGEALEKKKADLMFNHLKSYRDNWNWLELGLDDVGYRLEELLHLLEFGNESKWGKPKKRLPPEKLTPLVNKAFEELGSAIDLTLDEHQFIMVDRQKRRFAEEDDLFGKPIAILFPSTKSEIKDAGLCIAVDLNTAAVFHLMRIVEFGLRALAVHLGIKKIKKNVPIEYATWEEIIFAMKKKTEALGLNTRSKKRQTDLDFYNELLSESRSIKDLWRNPVSHARRTFTDKDAEAIWGHVKNFMQKLATKVSETKR